MATPIQAARHMQLTFFDPPLKVCLKCKTEKPVADFHRDRNRQDGRFPWCKTCKYASDKEHHAAKRTERNERNRRYRAAHLDEERRASRLWYERNRARRIALSAAWRKANPEQAAANAKASDARRRTRERNGLGRFDRELSRAYRLAIAGDPCTYCGAPGEHDDHMTPLARGGTDHWWNLTRACAACNWSKNAMTAEEFIASGRIKRAT